MADPTPPLPTPSSTLPKFLTTVTPLSKFVAAVLFVAFPFVGFYAGTRYQQAVSLVGSASSGDDQATSPQAPLDDNLPTPADMTLDKKIYLDFDADGQQEIVLIGTDQQHIAGGQVGDAIQMPLIYVFKYSPAAKSWEQAAQMNYTHFPGSTNGSLLSQIVIVSLGQREGLVTTSYVSGSHINTRFQAIAATPAGIQVYGFPEADYLFRGGGVPQNIEVSVDGSVILHEGLFKPADSNNNPTNGSLLTKYQVDATGVHFVSLDKLPYNWTPN